jgi:hypothetical protein
MKPGVFYGPAISICSPDRSGRYCEIAGTGEIKELVPGTDFRQPEYRREVFFRFYEFHLRYRSHPGAVYYVIPFLSERFGWDMEARLWFAFLNGNTQNPITSFIIFSRFPTLTAPGLEEWFRANYQRLSFDTDRRHQKRDFIKSVECYRKLIKPFGGSQELYFRSAFSGEEKEDFRRTWKRVYAGFETFARLSTFSYLEYLRIVGLPIVCDQLFLEDLSGSKSHRNGLARILGRDDLDWHDSNPNGFSGQYRKEVMEWLKMEGDMLINTAARRFSPFDFARDVNFFTLESAFCTYKSWHRPNRRYPNCYNDMFYNRILTAEKSFPELDLSIFREARREKLPSHLRLEDNPNDSGLSPDKQNHYLLTGQVIMMDREWSCFENDYNKRVRSGLTGPA